METRAPAVVAVVVTTSPGPGLEAALASLVAQDYGELNLLVVANGSFDNVAARVAAVAPEAFVKVLEDNKGFAAACNEAALMVAGSAFFLLCHDDVILEPDAVSLLVEAAYRTNAGIVSPKVVAYDDPLTLLHVGQTCDRFGVVRDRVEPGEVDHGQQDLERDVFVAPGGVTLIRSDLFTTLRGFDPLIPALGEDLDLCWRAQSAGARIIVAPQARVAHRETVLTGERPVTAVGTRNVSRQTLQRRHQLLVVATGYNRWRSLWTLLLLALMDAMELLLAVIGRDGERAGAILGSWRWLLFHRRLVVSRRRQRQETRVLSDQELTRLQVAGASRLQRFLLVLARDGLDVARGILPEPLAHAPVNDEDAAGVGFAAAFSEDEEFDEGLATMEERRADPRRLLNSFRSQALTLILVAVLWAIGSRDLVATHLPLIGRLAPLDSWWSNWRHAFASWSPNGVGTGAPGMPGYGLLAFAGTFVFGRMGILPRLALIGAVPFGALGVARLLKNRVSNRARVVAVVAYLTLPAGLNMIGQGRTDVLVVVAGLPFVLRRLLELLAVPGFRDVAYPDPVPFGQRGWRVSEAGQRMSVIMMLAVMTAFAPATLVLVVLIVVGVWLARLLEADEEPGRPWRLLGSLIFNVAIFLLPMTVDTVVAGRRAFELFGLPRGPWTAPTWTALLRGADGGFGLSWWGWLLPGVAVVALVLSRGVRRAAASKAATIAVLTLGLITLSDHHLLGSFAPDIDVLFVLYGLCLVWLAATGLGAIETDLHGLTLSWRQPLAVVSVLALVALSVPLVIETGSGRFDLPTTSVAESLSSLAPAHEAFRVLWLADPSVLPTTGWTVAPGIAAATSVDGLPGGDTLFTNPDAGQSDVIMNAVHDALSGSTVQLGAALATAGISAVVVMNTSAPTIAGVQAAPARPVPQALDMALANQTDLALVLQTSSVAVYANTKFTGLVSAVNATTGAATSLLGPTSMRAALAKGTTTVQADLAPAGAWALLVNGQPTARTTLGGWSPVYELPSNVPSGASVTLALRQFPFNGILAGFTLGMWLVIWLGFGWVQRLEWLFTGRRRLRQGADDAR